MTKAYSRSKPIVGTTNRSMAAMSGAWLRKKVRHPWLGGPRRLIMYLATLDCAISNPSLSSSPWMRGAPQRLLSVGRIKLTQIARDALPQLGTPPVHLRSREVLVPVVHGFELAAIDGNARRREKAHLAAEFDEARTYLA